MGGGRAKRTAYGSWFIGEGSGGLFKGRLSSMKL